MSNFNLYSRFTRMQNSQNPVNAADVSDDLVSTPSASGPRIAAGIATLVTGTVTIATGLNNIVSFDANVSTQPNGTGTASPQILVPTITTGSVVVTAYYISSITGATSAANTSTNAISWMAFGS